MVHSSSRLLDTESQTKLNVKLIPTEIRPGDCGTFGVSQVITEQHRQRCTSEMDENRLRGFSVPTGPAALPILCSSRSGQEHPIRF